MARYTDPKHYEPTVEYGSLIWIHNPDGEYGEYSTEYRGHKLTVSTNMEGNDWEYCINDGGMHYSWYSNTMKGAMKSAIEDTHARTHNQNGA